MWHRIGTVAAIASALTLFAAGLANAETYATINKPSMIQSFYTAPPNGDPLFLWPNYGGSYEEWTPQNQDQQGYFEIVNNNDSKCIDITAGGTADNTKIQDWTCNGNPQQYWHSAYYTGTTYALVSQKLNGSGGQMCMDDHNGDTANYAPVVSWTCLGDRNQTWE